MSALCIPIITVKARATATVTTSWERYFTK